MIAEVVNIDRKEVVNFTMARGQIFRFYITPEDNETPPDSDMTLFISYSGTVKSFINSYTLGDGIILNNEGAPYMEIDTKDFRESIDGIVCEWFPYGSGERTKLFNISFNNSGYGAI